jgi:hypothetical protein
MINKTSQLSKKSGGPTFDRLNTVLRHQPPKWALPGTQTELSTQLAKELETLRLGGNNMDLKEESQAPVLTQPGLNNQATKTVVRDRLG